MARFEVAVKYLETQELMLTALKIREVATLQVTSSHRFRGF